MGTWGIGHFENDDALDWAFALDDAQTLEPIESALDQFLASEEQDAGNEAAALAAAATLAALKSQPPDLPENIESYVDRVKIVPAPDILSKALQATLKIRESSELRELWEESGDLEGWLAEVERLAAMLKP